MSNFLEREISKLRIKNGKLIEVLNLIATPIRPDGTWNRDRLACQKLAEKALKESQQSPPSMFHERFYHSNF